MLIFFSIINTYYSRLHIVLLSLNWVSMNHYSNSFSPLIISVKERVIIFWLQLRDTLWKSELKLSCHYSTIRKRLPFYLRKAPSITAFFTTYSTINWPYPHKWKITLLKIILLKHTSFSNFFRDMLKIFHFRKYKRNNPFTIGNIIIEVKHLWENTH